MTSPAPLLVLAVGNPSRGDDAIGPRFADAASLALAPEIARGEVEVLTDFQLQIEHALDLEGRRRVLFVDASVDASSPFEVRRAAPERDASFTSHALSPGAVLAALARGLRAATTPDALVLAIRAERFELGDPLSPEAEENLAAALAWLVSSPARALLYAGGT